MNDAHELERELIERAQSQLHEKIDEGNFNGDIEENILLVLFSINRRVGRICSNPLVLLGEYFQKYPKMVIPSLLVLWALIGASVVVAVVGFMDITGLTIKPLP